MRIITLLLIFLVALAGIARAQAQALTREQQEKMLRVLRQQMGTLDEPSAAGKTNAASAKPSKKEASKKPATEPAAKTSKPTAEKKSAPAPAAKLQPVPSTNTVLTPALENAAPAGPKSKKERLAALLEQYRADKIEPAEYHQQRAKILAEP